MTIAEVFHTACKKACYFPLYNLSHYANISWEGEEGVYPVCACMCIIHHSAFLIRNIFCCYWEERRERRRVEEERLGKKGDGNEQRGKRRRQKRIMFVGFQITSDSFFAQTIVKAADLRTCSNCIQHPKSKLPEDAMFMLYHMGYVRTLKSMPFTRVTRAKVVQANQCWQSEQRVRTRVICPSCVQGGLQAIYISMEPVT